MKEKMRKYYVEAPIVGKFVAYVEAENEDEALEKVMQAAIEIPVTVMDRSLKEAFLEEFDIREQVNRGNVCYSPIGEAMVEEVE